MTLPIAQQIAAVVREIDLRKHVYPRLVEQRKMTDEKRHHEIAAMESVWNALRALPLLTSACEELLHYARNTSADPEMLDRCSAALRAAGSRI